MRLHFKIFLLLMSLGGTAFSQVLVGPLVGGNYSFTTFGDKDLNEVYNVRGVSGYHFGGHLSFKVRKRFFLHSSLIYSTKGRTMTSSADPSFKYRAQNNFIELPIAYTVDFKARLGDSKEFKYFLGIGPNLSYWLGGKGTLNNIDLEENHINEIHYRTIFQIRDGEQSHDQMLVVQPNRIQFGLNFVGGLVFEPADRQRIMLTLRYEVGHTYLAKTDGIFLNTYFQDLLQSRNQGFRISVAYLYDLKTADRNKGRSTIDKRNPK